MIGDPGGRESERELQSAEVVERQLDRIRVAGEPAFLTLTAEKPQQWWSITRTGQGIYRSSITCVILASIFSVNCDDTEGIRAPPN